jgi:hypothetical protein
MAYFTIPDTCLTTKIPHLKFQIFKLYCLYIKTNSCKEKKDICLEVGDPFIKMPRIPLPSLTPQQVCACPKPGLRFPTSYVIGLFFVQWEVIVRYMSSDKIYSDLASACHFRHWRLIFESDEYFPYPIRHLNFQKIVQKCL